MASVFIKTDDNGDIIAINSGAFIDDTDNWTKIDEGDGDKYAHAQNNYLDKSVFDEYGRPNYKYYRKKVKEIPDAEKTPIPEPEPTITIDDLAAAVAELAEIIAGV